MMPPSVKAELVKPIGVGGGVDGAACWAKDKPPLKDNNRAASTGERKAGMRSSWELGGAAKAVLREESSGGQRLRATSAKKPPCGSWACRIHWPPGTSIGPIITLPPAFSTRPLAASM